MHAVVAIDLAEVLGTAVFVDSIVIINGRAVDALALHGGGVNGRIAGGLERRIWHRDGPATSRRRGRGTRPTAGARGARSAVGRFEHGVSHAASLAIEDDVFDHADFTAIGAADFRADDFAALDVRPTAGARRGGTCGGLGLSAKRGDGKTHCRQGRSEDN